MRYLRHSFFPLALALLIQHTHPVRGQVSCGPNVCSASQYCCNESCGICTDSEEGPCTLQYCPPKEGFFPMCFSGESTVEIETKGQVAMKNVHVGDRILTASGKFQTLYAFGHYDEMIIASFLQIHTENMTKPLEVSTKHLIYVKDPTGGQSAPRAAGDIQVGDILQANGLISGSRVRKIQTVKRTGMYAPFTTDGTLVVDGIVASSYVFLSELESNSWLKNNIATVSHLAVTPIRLWCTYISNRSCSDYNDDGVPHIFASLLSWFQWLSWKDDGPPLGLFSLVFQYASYVAEWPIAYFLGLACLTVGIHVLTGFTNNEHCKGGKPTLMIGSASALRIRFEV